MAFSVCVVGGAAAQTVGPKTIVTYGPWGGKPVNEPQVAAYGPDRMVVLWNIQNIPDVGQVEAPDSVAYTTWDPVLNEWRDWRNNAPILPIPFGSDSESRPFVTATSDDVFLAGAVSLFGNVGNTFTVHMDNGFNVFNPLSLFHFSDCNVDYPGIGYGPGTIEGSSRTVILERVNVGSSGCGITRQIAQRESIDEGLFWDDHDPMAIGVTEILGIPSPPVIVVNGDARSSYSTIDGEFVRAFSDGSGTFNTPVDLGLDETRNLTAGVGQTYFEAANDEVAGEFQIGPFTSLAATPGGGSTFVAYADIDPESGPDDDFNIYVVADDGLGWSAPIQVNGGPSGTGRADQFMPRIVHETTGGDGIRLHAVWYDTRNDLQSNGSDNVKVSLYYAFSDDAGLEWTETELDEVAIDTRYLDNPNFIGDHIDLTVIPGTEDVLVVYMGTRHPTAGGGFNGGGAGGGYSNSGAGGGGGGSNNFSPDPAGDTNEAIFSIVVSH